MGTTNLAEVSIVLLKPQAFLISVDKAITLASEHGLAPAGEASQVHLVLGPATGGRFAQEVTNPSVTPRAEHPNPSSRSCST
jgi:hypothetical protein